MSPSPRIVVYGAGSIGCYVGGRLLAAGADVTLLGRERLQRVFSAHPLQLTDYLGYAQTLTLTESQFTTDAAVCAQADLLLLTVKSAATEAAGQELKELLPAGTTVVSLQNGISNAQRLQQILPQCRVIAGMVPFNVLQKSPGHFHQGTEGHLMAASAESLERCLPLFNKAGLPLELRTDMDSVMWSKLLLNLNNPVNALSGLPLKEQLSQRGYRRCLALAQEETLALLQRAGIPLIRLTAVPTPWIPRVMRLPDWLFTRLASKMLAIDPIARSSMWEDLEAGRATEIDWINGEVVKLAEQLGQTAPVNKRLVSLVHEAENGGRRNWPSEELYQTLSA